MFTIYSSVCKSIAYFLKLTNEMDKMWNETTIEPLKLEHILHRVHRGVKAQEQSKKDIVIHPSYGPCLSVSFNSTIKTSTEFLDIQLNVKILQENSGSSDLILFFHEGAYEPLF